MPYQVQFSENMSRKARKLGTIAEYVKHRQTLQLNCRIHRFGSSRNEHLSTCGPVGIDTDAEFRWDNFLVSNSSMVHHFHCDLTQWAEDDSSTNLDCRDTLYMLILESFSLLSICQLQTADQLTLKGFEQWFNNICASIFNL